MAGLREPLAAVERWRQAVRPPPASLKPSAGPADVVRHDRRRRQRGRECALGERQLRAGENTHKAVEMNTGRIEDKVKEDRGSCSNSDVALGLQTMPGIGPMTALAIEAFAPARPD